jgi:potassium efflux system protein
MPKRSLLHLFFSGLMLCSSMLATAADQIELPSQSKLESSLAALNKRDSLTVVEKAQKEDIEQTLSLLDQIEKQKQWTVEQSQAIAKTPQKLKDYTKQLETLQQNNDRDTDRLKKSIDQLTQSQLDKKIATLLDTLQNAQNDLNTANGRITFLQTLPERSQSSMSKDYERMQEIRNMMSGVNNKQTGEISISKRIRLSTELALLQLRQDSHQKDLDNNTAEQDLFNKQRDLLNAQISQTTNWLQILQQQANSKRLTQTEKAVEESSNNAANSDTATSPVLQNEQKMNQQLSQQLMAATQQVNTLVQENIKVKNWLDRGTQTEQNLNEQISVLKGSLLLSKILVQQQQMLPDASEVQDLDEKIADLRLAQFDINQQRDQLYQRADYINKLAEDAKTKLTDDQTDTLNDLLDSRKELLDQLNKQLGQQLNLTINLQLNQQQLARVSKSLQSTFQQQIFWVSSNKQIDWSWITAFPSAVSQQIQSASINISLKNWRTHWLEVVPATLVLWIIAGLMLWKRHAIQGKFDKYAKEVGQLRVDTHYHTPKAIGLILLRTIPGAMLISSAGLLFMYSGLTTPSVIRELAFRMALAYMAFGSIRRMLKPDSLAQIHFGYAPTIIAHYRHVLGQIWYTLLPLILIATLGELDPSRLATDVTGQLICLLSLLCLVFELFRAVRNHPNAQQKSFWSNMSAYILALIPLTLVILLVFGYYYTSLKLSARLIDSFYVVSVWVLLYQSAMRGLAVAARRLAYRRAIAKRQQQQQRNENGEPAPAEVPLDDKDRPITLEEINQQTLRLVKVTLTLIFAGSFYWLWSDLVTVITYLDSITLWHHTIGAESNNPIIEAVSLLDLLIAGVIGAVTYILTRNLPGLLEVLVLSKLSLAQGTSYAITTILSYLITATGTIATLSIVGMEWNKLQWLVAALSVGLGFGLQEIFANFVSGLIILFERPVRIGDTITVSGFSGTVNKIRIRATTITDFDRKEIIIPNRAFVTERLINWSLSDTVTRVVLRVGVAYGSDLDLVKKLLLQAASENHRVMKEPEPSVFFLAFGASTLDHEMRFFVRELGDRNAALDELNRRIDHLFNAHDINIAFNQVEVTLKNTQGDVLNFETGKQLAAAAAAHQATGTPIDPTAPTVTSGNAQS